MGNCQAAEAATVVIQHPGNKIERFYWSVSAHEIMISNPGHYVALVVTSPTLRAENGAPLKQFKLLRPDDSLLLGQVYRLISFEDVLKEFAAKKCVKLGKLLRDTERRNSGGMNPNSNSNSVSKSEKCSFVKSEKELHRLGSNSGSSTSASGSNSSNSSVYRGVGRHHHGGGSSGGRQWKPALQSISEVGT